MKIEFTKCASLLALLLSFPIYAQVGINAGENPKGTLEVGYNAEWAEKGKAQGVIFPMMTTEERKAMKDVPIGLMIYNTTKNCIDYYDGTFWQCSDGKQKEYAFWDTFDPNKDPLPVGYIKDRNYGDGEHDFIYKIIKGLDGKRWLNLNLGAEYANVHSPNFNPDKQAVTLDDYRAYGSLFQWQRKADGHEIIDWYASNAGTPAHGISNVLASSWLDAGTKDFIVFDFNSNWVQNGELAVGSELSLWRANGANNPCPQGFHVPTKLEWETHVGANDNNAEQFKGFDTTLRLPVAGHRLRSLEGQPTVGYYWSSEDSTPHNAWQFVYHDAAFYVTGDNNRVIGMSVRCIQD